MDTLQVRYDEMSEIGKDTHIAKLKGKYRLLREQMAAVIDGMMSALYELVRCSIRCECFQIHAARVCSAIQFHLFSYISHSIPRIIAVMYR